MTEIFLESFRSTLRIFVQHEEEKDKYKKKVYLNGCNKKAVCSDKKIPRAYEVKI